MTDTRPNNTDWKDLTGFIALAILITTLWFFAPSIFRSIWGASTNIEVIYVAVGTLFSGLAFVGVIAAIVLQRRELQLQRQELKETRQEFEHQTEQLRQQNKTLRESNTYEMLTRLLLEYRSPEMLLAIETLWNFYERHSGNFVQVYDDHYKETRVAIAKLPANRKFEEERASLHYQRRLVSQFYGLLSGLYEAEVIPKDVLYAYWGEQDLRIIPKILLPLEKGIQTRLGTIPGQDTTTLARLQRLYDDNPWKNVEI